MKPTLSLIVAATLLLGTAPRLPAPISEEEKPTATPAKPKPVQRKETSSSDASRKSERGFNGTWAGGSSVKNERASATSKFTMVIKGKSVESTADYTITLAPGQPSWGGNLEPYNAVRSIYVKWSWNSTDLTVDGSNLRVRWPVPQLVDWSPKTIPLSVIQGLPGVPAHTSIYTLKGDQLTRDFDSAGGVTYHRVR